jgi:hypothetical protein
MERHPICGEMDTQKQLNVPLQVKGIEKNLEQAKAALRQVEGEIEKRQLQAGKLRDALLESGVAIWSKIGFVVDFRNLLFGCDFDLSFSKDYSLMKIFNYKADFTAKCDT